MSETTPVTGAPIHIGFLVQRLPQMVRGRLVHSEPVARACFAAAAKAADNRIRAFTRYAARKAETLCTSLAQRGSHAVPRLAALKSPCPELALWKHGVAELKAVVPEIAIYDGSEADLIRLSRDARVDVLMPVMRPIASTVDTLGGLYARLPAQILSAVFPCGRAGLRDRSLQLMLNAPYRVHQRQSRDLDLERPFPGGRAKLFSCRSRR